MYGNVGRYCNGRLSSIFLQFTKSTCQPMLVVLVGQEWLRQNVFPSLVYTMQQKRCQWLSRERDELDKGYVGSLPLMRGLSEW